MTLTGDDIESQLTAAGADVSSVDSVATALGDVDVAHYVMTGSTYGVDADINGVGIFATTDYGLVNITTSCVEESTCEDISGQILDTLDAA